MAEAPSIGDETLTPDDALDVLEELLDARNDSYELGLKLKLPLAEVEAIHSNYSKPRSRLLQVIISFLKQVQPRPTWRVIVDALRSPAVNLPALAKSMEAAHFPAPSTPAPSTHNVVHGMSTTDTVAISSIPSEVSLASSQSEIPVQDSSTEQKPHHTSREASPKEQSHPSPSKQLHRMSSRYVKDNIRQLVKRFNELKKASTVNLEKQSIAVRRVANALSTLPADGVNEHKQFQDSHLSVFYNASDHSELFGAMSFNWNYLSYHLLDHLIKAFDLEVKGEMEAYKKDLQQFREKTPLTVFCRTQKSRCIKPSQDFQEMVTEFDWPQNVTLVVVEQFRQEYSCFHGLRECAMMFAVVRPGSFVITWFIPESIVDELKVNVPRDILKKHFVTKLDIAGTCIYHNPTKQD